MVYVIRGKINEGKTNKILSIYNQNKTGDGFITEKIFKEGLPVGYKLVRLSSLASIPFIYESGHEPSGWNVSLKYKKYSFSKEALLLAESIIDEIISNRIDPVFIDEIGPVELEGWGLYEAFKKSLGTGRNIYVTVRESCVHDVLQLFKIDRYEIIQL